MVYQTKSLPMAPASHMVPVQVPTIPLLSQLPATVIGREAKMAQVLEPLYPHGRPERTS